MNTCCFKIRVGKVPDLRYSANGTAVASFTGFINEKVNGKDRSVALRFVAFGKLAEFIAQNVEQGNDGNVVCSVQGNEWEKDGQKIYQLQFVISSFDLLQWSVTQPKQKSNGNDYEDEEDEG